MPLRNAFVPIPDIIQIPEKSSSDSCTKYATHIAPLLVRDAAYGGQLCVCGKQQKRAAAQQFVQQPLEMQKKLSR